MSDENQKNNNDEILVMDETGQFKLLSGGVLKPYTENNQTKNQNNQVSSVKSVISHQEPSSNLPIDTGLEEKMLQPPTPIVYKKNASFYFHPDDEEEVAKIKAEFSKPEVKVNQPEPAKATVATIATGPKKRFSLDKILFKVIENYKLKIDANISSRLRLAIFSYLRDRRTLIDTQAILEKNIDTGGVGLDMVTTSSLLDFLKQLKENINSSGGLVVDEKEEMLKKSQDYESPKDPKVISKPIDTKPVPKLEDVLPASVMEPAKPLVDKINPASKLQRPIKSAENMMTDVKRNYKLIGPIEELGQLDLDTFRRLGSTTAERAQKVVLKVNALAETSLVKKATGIKAWRNSPLYNMYVAVGQASMESNLSVDEIIKKYHQAGRQIIGIDEFEAISDINRKLRF